MRGFRIGVVIVGHIALSSGCSGEVAKDATAAVVGKSIEVGKSTVTGIASGIQEGRKNAASADGALIVSTADELKAHGGGLLGGITAAGDGADVAVLIENKGDQPMRVTGLDVLVLDTDGVVLRPSTPPEREVTVPPHAKARVVVAVPVSPHKVGVVRLFGVDVAR
jgi:hypothetical protein